MSPAEREARRVGLEIDIDSRTADAWASIFRVDLSPTEEAVVACAIRLAYALGYRDALKEDSVGRRNALARENGYSRI